MEPFGRSLSEDSDATWRISLVPKGRGAVQFTKWASARGVRYELWVAMVPGTKRWSWSLARVLDSGRADFPFKHGEGLCQYDAEGRLWGALWRYCESRYDDDHSLMRALRSPP